MKRALFLLSALLAAPLCAQTPDPSPSPAAAPSPPPTVFGSDIEVVNVDVVVMDKKGNPVTGLTRDDFVLKDEGKPQEINSFEALVAPEAAPSGAAPPLPSVSSNAGARDRKGRTFNIVFDDIHLTAGQALRAKAAVSEFLKSGVRDGDTVSLASTGGAAWWSVRMPQGRDELTGMLKRLDGRMIPDIGQDRITDYEAMRIVLFSDPQVTERVSRRFETYGVGMQRGSTDTNIGQDPLVRARAQEVYFQTTSRSHITLQVMERVLKSLSSTRGRKSMILVSEGFIYDPSLSEFKEVVDAARRANVAIYFLDTRGLGGLPASFSAEFGPAIDERDVGFAFGEAMEAGEGSESIALDSGGFAVSNTNDLAQGIRRIAAESQSYYLLGFTPGDVKRDGKFRKLDVKVSRKDVQVRFRRGYYAPSDAKKSDKDKEKEKKTAPSEDPDIQKALDSPYDSDVIPMRMSAYVFDETMMGKASTYVATEVDVDGFDFEEKDGRFLDTLEFLLVVAHRETGEFFRYDQKVEMKLLPETRQKARINWLPVVRDFELQPGGYQAKIVVRDKRSGRIGTVLHPFEVPPLGAFRVSTPIISDTLAQTSEEGKTPRPPMLAHREFAPGAMIYCQFDVFGAEKDVKSGMPQVSAGYMIRAKGGAVLFRVAPSVIKPTSLGKLTRLVGSELKDAGPGDYELVLTLKDEIGGKSLERVEPFTLVSPPVAD